MSTRGKLWLWSALGCAALLASCASSEPIPASETSGAEATQPPAASGGPQPQTTTPPAPSATATTAAAPAAAAAAPAAASGAAPAAVEAAPAVGSAAAPAATEAAPAPVTSAAPTASGAGAAAVAVAPTAASGAGPGAAAVAPAAASSAAPAASAKPSAAAQPTPAAPAPAATKPAPPPSAAAPQPAAAAPPLAAAAVPANAPGRVVVDLLGLTSDTGQVLAALFRSSTGFPEEPQRAQQRKTVKIRGRRVELAFDNVPPGPFAVSLFHDEDANNKMKTGMFGIPSEGYGFTRDARGSFGPPSFEDARLQLSAGETKKVTIHMKY